MEFVYEIAVEKKRECHFVITWAFLEVFFLGSLVWFLQKNQHPFIHVGDLL